MICWESSSPILDLGYLIGLSNVFQLLTSFRKLLDWTLPALPILKIVQLLVDLSPTFNIYNIFFLSPFEFLFAKSKFDRKFVRGTAVNIFNSGLRFILRSIGNICPSLALLKSNNINLVIQWNLDLRELDLRKIAAPTNFLAHT